MKNFSKPHAARAAKIVKKWGELTRSGDEALQYQVAGLLADLLHLVAEKHLDFEEALARANDYYFADLEE